MKIFRIFAQNIDCGCTLEPPRPKIGIPQFYYIKVGYLFHGHAYKNRYTTVLLYKSGVFISRTCFPDALKASLPYF